MAAEDYKLRWVGQRAVVTVPAEIDVTNAEQIRHTLVSAAGLATTTPRYRRIDRLTFKIIYMRFPRRGIPRASPCQAGGPAGQSSLPRPPSLSPRLPGSRPSFDRIEACSWLSVST
jgi:hypothetical protein